MPESSFFTLAQLPFERRCVMYKVLVRLPLNKVRTIYMHAKELESWLSKRYLSERIVKYELREAGYHSLNKI